MKKIFYILIFISLLTLTNCRGGKHAPQTDSSQSNSDISNSADTQKIGNSTRLGPTYSSEIKPLFEKNCIPCHDKTSAIGNWLDYKTAFTKRALIKTRVFEKKDMPLGKSLADKDRALIAKWVDSGALDSVEENTSSQEPQTNTQPSSPPHSNDTVIETPPELKDKPAPPAAIEPVNSTDIDAEKLTYVEHIKPFFEKYCSACHNENSGPVMPNWLQYDIVVLKKEALLERVVNKKNMPLEGMPAPSLEEREMLNLWIQKGLKYEIK